ncbi:MAG: hypothetical protein V5A39_07055 [Haloarculaceae archaeon]
METLADVVARGRTRDGAALDAPDRAAPYSYREFCTNAWKAGNLLRHYGVRRDGTLALVVGPKSPAPDDEPGVLGSAAAPLLALFGGATVGAAVDVTPASPVDARALVAPDAWLDRYEAEPGCSRLAYGGPPEAADVAHLERELWSENPIEPPDEVSPGAVLRIEGERYTHRALLDAASAVVDDHSLAAGDSVGLDAPLTHPGPIAAGVLAPLMVGATIRPGVTGHADADESPTYFVSSGGTSESGRDGDTVAPASVPLEPAPKSNSDSQ